MKGDPQLLFHICNVKYSRLWTEMKFYLSVFPEKKIQKYCKTGRSWGIYPSIFTLSDQSHD